MKKQLDFVNEELNEHFTFFDFVNLCNAAAATNALKFARDNPYTDEDIEKFHTNNYFMFFRLCSVVKDTYHEKRFQQVLSKVKGKILDFGGGLGDYASMLADKGFHVDYYDINNLCRKYVQKYYPKVHILENTTNLGKYETIICFDVLHYVSRPEVLRDYLQNHLTKDGMLFTEKPY